MVKISDAEYEVMKVIWKRKKATSLEVIDDLQPSNWNFNTVRTLIKRLQIKGAIEVSGTKGRAYIYEAVIDKDEYRNEITKDLLKRLYNDSLEEFILQYASGVKVTADDFKEALENLEEKEAAQKVEEQRKNEEKK